MGGCFVQPKGQLSSTSEWGLLECGPSCKLPECSSSRVVSQGITLPLEIFKTEKEGWGVRCAIDIAAGSFICEYSGAVCTDREANHRIQDYLFNLDHFILLSQRRKQPKLQSGRKVYPRPPPDLHGGSDFLTVDASQCGNVGRFLNHSCNDNVVVQTVLTPGSSALQYKIAFFALRDIRKGEELVYDYGWTPQAGAAQELWCACGAANCQGRLL